MLQIAPQYSQPSTEKTEIWVMFDGDNIYIAAKCWDTAPPEKWIANELRRDTNQMRQNDHFGVGFDTFYDRRSGYMFYANPIGGFSDYSVVDEGAPNTDWNPVWTAKTGPLRGRLDDRDAVSVQVAALHVGLRSGVGHPVPPFDPPQERVGLLDAGAAPHGGPAGAQPRLSMYGTVVGLDLPTGRTQSRAEALRTRQDDDRSADESADDQRQGRRCRRRREVRRSPRTSQRI